jgi:hypothetical protein
MRAALILAAALVPLAAAGAQIQSPGLACANEPAGATRINDMPWDSVPRHTHAITGWLDDAGNAQQAMSILVDSTSPMPWTNHNVVAALFPAGAPGGAGPFYVYRPFSSSEQYHTLYVCLYMKHSANFDNTNGNVENKFMWPAGDQVEGSQTYVTFYGPNMDFGIEQQGGVDRGMFANLGPSGQVLNQRGQWVEYEFLLKASSSNSTPDGQLDIWINGVHTHHYVDVAWQMGSSRRWQSLAWTPTYGGGLNPVPHDQYEYIDHIRISGK